MAMSLMRSVGAVRSALPKALPAVQFVPNRGMASEKDIRNRIEATGSIAKITSSMKMVAAAKMRGAERVLNEGKDFGTVMAAAAFPEQEDMENPDIVGSAGNHHMFIVVTSDRGLCGGVNAVVMRKLRDMGGAMEAAGKSFSVFVIGDKGKGGAGRMFPSQFIGGVDQCYPKTGVSFDIAGAITERILTQEFDSASLTYNKFVSAIQYDTHTKMMVKLAMKEVEVGQDGTPEHLKAYEVEPEDKAEAMQNLYEYSMSTTIFGAMLENAVSELSARMSAMENASKNAGEMIERLTLQYNRARQSRITTELIEIISGAESLEG